MQPRHSAMNDLHAPPFDRLRSFQSHSALDNTSTAYHGAAGNVDDCSHAPLIRLDKTGFEDIRLNDPTPFSPTNNNNNNNNNNNTREGLGSRLLSTLSTNSPTAAALQRSGTILHTRAKSWAAYVPKLSASPNTSPDKPQRQSKIFGDLFNGDSAPVHLGLPTSPLKEKEEDTEFVMEYRPSFTERPSPRDVRKSSTATVVSSNKGGKASWFSRKAGMPATPPTDTKDELLHINIQNSLFPHGPADPLSPQAFNDLLLNATSLLQRMQDEYKKKVEYISNIQPEIDAQREEVEEAETRAAHLKIQLEDIGRQFQEQKRVNEEVLQQLSMEKMKLSEARESVKSVRLVRRETEDTEAGGTDDDENHRRRKRGSAGSDSGFESDADTSSVFSAGMETPVSSRHAHHMSGMQSPQILSPDYDLSAPQTVKPDRMSLFSRYSGLSQQSTAYSQSQRQQQQQQNLRLGGGEAAAAWATVESLRRENQQLRMQMGNMQDSLQGCIDFVGGVNIST